MPIPDYQTLMLPLLRQIRDGQNHELRNLLVRIADELGLSDVERVEPLESGRGRKLYSRVQWAITYMAQAGLLDKVSRGLYRITRRGSELLATSPQRIDNIVLRRYPEFLEFRSRSHNRPVDEVVSGDSSTAASDPDTMLEDAVGTIREQIVSELVGHVKALAPGEFELLAIELLEKVGYGRGRPTGGSGDRGIDGVLEADALGLDRVYVQCKRFTDTNVGGGDIRNFIGALHQHRATRGVFMTTGSFTAEASAAVASSTYSIALLDGRRIAELMYDNGVGVIPDRTFVIKRIDEGRFTPR